MFLPVAGTRQRLLRLLVGGVEVRVSPGFFGGGMKISSQRIWLAETGCGCSSAAGFQDYAGVLV